MGRCWADGLLLPRRRPWHLPALRRPQLPVWLPVWLLRLLLLRLLLRLLLHLLLRLLHTAHPGSLGRQLALGQPLPEMQPGALPA